MVFKVQQNTPAAHFYGGAVDRVADSLHGRHVIVDAVGSLYSTCRRALASPEDSSERALARSALARRARRWGCTCSPVEWLGSRAHLDTAVVMESEMESGRVTVEAFDFFILYTAWLTRHDGDIYQERAARGEKPAPLRDVLTLEHVQDDKRLECAEADGVVPSVGLPNTRDEPAQQQKHLVHQFTISPLKIGSRVERPSVS